VKVGILGSGDIGKMLAGGVIKHGHQVTLGTRMGDKLVAAQNPSARIGGFAETATFGELGVLAVKGTVALDALQLAGAAALAGKQSSTRQIRSPIHRRSTAC
jgi:predicted dinucleotide-binding enzyme